MLFDPKTIHKSFQIPLILFSVNTSFLQVALSFPTFAIRNLFRVMTAALLDTPAMIIRSINTKYIISHVTTNVTKYVTNDISPSAMATCSARGGVAAWVDHTRVGVMIHPGLVTRSCVCEDGPVSAWETRPLVCVRSTRDPT